MTKINDPNANVKLATSWLKLAGCKTIFYVDSKKQQGIPEILEHLREEGDVMPWEEAEANQEDVEKTGKPRKTT